MTYISRLWRLRHVTLTLERWQGLVHGCVYN